MLQRKADCPPYRFHEGKLWKIGDQGFYRRNGGKKERSFFLPPLLNRLLF